MDELHEEELERERRVAELHDEKLFKQPPPREDCPICMILLPSSDTGSKYSACCGKVICGGCIHAVEKRDGGVRLCPFCRTPTPDTEEIIEQMKKRMEVDDAVAIYEMGCCYSDGDCGLPQDRAKALELWHRAAELGNTASYHNIGMAYLNGNGVERDKKKAYQYWEVQPWGFREECWKYGKGIKTLDNFCGVWIFCLVGEYQKDVQEWAGNEK